MRETKPTWRLSLPASPAPDFRRRRWVECPIDGCSTISRADRDALSGHISDKHPHLLVRWPRQTAWMVDACVGGAR